MADGVELATAWVRLVPSMEGTQGAIANALGDSGIDDAADDAGRRSGGRFSGALKAGALAGAALAAAGLVKVFNTGMEELKFGEQLNAQTDVLVKNTGFAMSTDKINDYTLALSKVSGISEEDLQGAGNELLKFGDLSEETYKQAVDSINDMGAAGKDVAGVGTALGKALADPAKAAGILKKQGVLLNEEQTAMIAKMTEAGDKAGAQKVILDALNGTYDGMAEKTGGTLEGNMNKLNNAFENVSGDLVANLMPAITAVVDNLQKFVIWIGENQTLFNILLGIVAGLAIALGVLTVVQWALNAAFLASPVTWIILGILALIAAIVLLVMNWDKVVAWITNIWQGFINWIMTVIDGFVGWWNGIWTAVGQAISDIWNGFIGWITDLWNGYIAWLTAVIVTLLVWWIGVWTSFGKWISDIWNGFIGWITDTWNGFTSWLTGAVDGLLSWWNGVWEGFQDTISTVWTAIGDFIQGIWDGIVLGMKKSINLIISAINTMIDGLNVLLSGVNKLTGSKLEVPNIPGLATGGSITKSGTVLVGENGPELLHLPRGASVDPDIDRFRDDTGTRAQVNVYPQPGQSEESIGRIAADRLDYELRKLG